MYHCLLLSLLVSQVLSVSIGDRLIRTYTKYVSLPTNISSAINDGWKTSGTCLKGLGIPYNYGSSGPTEDAPLTLYFSSTGAVVGVGVDVYGDVESNLLSRGFFNKVGSSQYRITVTFASVGAGCSAISNQTSLGDRLVINADTIAYPIPATESEAVSTKWHKGSCFYGMGYHYFYDLETAPNMSWKAGNVVPSMCLALSYLTS